MDKLNELLKVFKRKYPWTIAWRVKKHAKVIKMHLNPGENVKYAFAAQKTKGFFQMFFTSVVVITNKRLLLATDRVLFGYFLTSITPDMYNDLKVKSGLIWGNIEIDTIKELVELSHISLNALDEIETEITEFMIKERKKMGLNALRSKI